MGVNRRQPDVMSGVGVGVGVSLVAAAALRYALRKKRDRNVFTLSDWRQQQQEDGSIKDWLGVLEHISEKGIRDPEAKSELWPLLLGVFEPGASEQARQGALEAYHGAYQQLIAMCQDIDQDILERVQRQQQRSTGLLQQLQHSDADGKESPASPGLPATAKAAWPPLSQLDLPQELSQFYEAQRIIVMDAIRTDFKKNSLTTVGAISSWVSSTLADTTVYQKLSSSKDWEQSGDQQAWVSSLARHQLQLCTHFGSEQKRQLLRLVSLLTAYAVHDPETGYCQGMSDLALPFLLLLEDDAIAFWCFEKLMRKVRRNFAVEDTGIFAQLAKLASLLEELDPTLHYKLRQVGATDCHFAYRMIVVLMRRELPLEKALMLWEIMWSDDLLAAIPGYAARQEESKPCTPRGEAAQQLQDREMANGVLEPAAGGDSPQLSSRSVPLSAADASGQGEGKAGASAQLLQRTSWTARMMATFRSSRSEQVVEEAEGAAAESSGTGITAEASRGDGLARAHTQPVTSVGLPMSPLGPGLASTDQRDELTPGRKGNATHSADSEPLPHASWTSRVMASFRTKTEPPHEGQVEVEGSGAATQADESMPEAAGTPSAAAAAAPMGCCPTWIQLVYCSVPTAPPQ